MWAPLFDAIATRISWNVSWATMHSFPHKQRNKWIFKSSMVSSHWHCEKYKNIGCGIPKQIWNALRKLAKDKQNEGVLGQVDNQALAIRHAQEWKHAHTTFEKTSIKSQINSCSCNWSIKEDCI